MKRLVNVASICLLFCISLVGCSNRYTFIQESLTIDEKIKSIEIEEIDSTVIVEFSDEFKQLKVNYRESKEVDEIRYDISSKDNLLKIRKNDSTNGFAVHFGSSDVEEEIPELKVEIPKAYMDSIDISATDCSVKIIGGEIGDLRVRTSYYPIELIHTDVKNFTGVTKNGSIIASIIGDSSDFTVRSKTENGENNLEAHAYTGQKQLNLETKDGNIEVKFVKD